MYEEQQSKHIPALDGRQETSKAVNYAAFGGVWVENCTKVHGGAQKWRQFAPRESVTITKQENVSEH